MIRSINSEIEENVKSEHIVSDTFKPTNKSLGQGCWGKVDEYVDTVGQSWAIKRFNPNEIAKKQMQERDWNEEDVMRREAVPLNAASRHIVPRIIERDKNGEMFVAMPVYDKDLSNRINSLDLEHSLKIARDIADALSYVHEQEKVFAGNLLYQPWNYDSRRSHGDVKPSNIFLKDGRAFLSDFGSSTCISIGGNGSKRGPHGDVNYRAPECFEENATPSVKGDIWSLGAILYESIAKEGIYNGFKGSYSDTNKLDRFVRKKLKNVPWKVRGFLKRCLSVGEYERFYNGTEALEGIEKVIENLDTKKVIKNHAKKWGLALGLPITIAGALVYGAATYEPQKLDMPKSNIQGMLYPASSKEESIEFEIEDINNLPPVGTIPIISGGLNNNAKLSTDNRIVAYLVKTHAQVQFSRGLLKSPKVYTDSQFSTYIAYTSNDERQMGAAQSRTPWPIWAKSIEVALNQAKTESGKVDLEDVMAVSRVGIDTVNQARRACGSFDYKDYRAAKDSKGGYILPKVEQDFINTWLAFYKANID
jgi:serine/threonine protein kinase